MRAIGRALRRRPTTAGVVVGVIFWWCSLVPSLLPRSWTVQAAISAICVAIGYGIGTFIGWFVRQFREGRPPLTAGVRDAATRRLGDRLPPWVPVVTVAAAIVVAGCVMWVRWQNQQRPLVDMPSVSGVVTVPMVVLTVVLSVVLVSIGRLVGGVVRRLDRWNRRHLPHALAVPTTIVLVVLVGGFLFRDVLADAFVTWADRSFSLVDDGTTPGTEQPTAATVSGSPDSLVRWDDLGLQGRDFVAGATPEEQLRDFATERGADPDDVVAPVRAYAGMDSATDVEERAQLVVDELVRSGGFDRELLVVATSTGTGWIDPDAARAIELMHGGDTAIASMQYSFLPSWISFIVDLDRASSAGAELFAAVHDEWASRPPDDRPQLIAFGLSLGSYGATAAFTGQEADTSVDNIVNQTDGALFVGTPYATELLRQMVDERQAGSPAWAPVVDDGGTVRFRTADTSLPEPTAEWEEPRVLFFQHSSDPVVHWYYNWFWSRPAWMDDPHGVDVPADPTWIPIVTGVQGVFDLMAGFSAPPGYGHDYRLAYPSAWAEVAAPEGWTDDDTVALEDYTDRLRASE